MLKITKEANSRMLEILKAENNPEFNIRVFVTGGQSNKFSYVFVLDPEVLSDDTVLHMDGFKLLMDPLSWPFLENAEVDFLSDNTGDRFVIRNASGEIV